MARAEFHKSNNARTSPSVIASPDLTFPFFLASFLRFMVFAKKRPSSVDEASVARRKLMGAKSLSKEAGAVVMIPTRELGANAEAPKRKERLTMAVENFIVAKLVVFEK